MSTGTISYGLSLEKEDRNGNRYILVRIQQNRKMKRVSTGVKVKKAHFHIARMGQWVDRKDPEFMEKKLKSPAPLTV